MSLISAQQTYHEIGVFPATSVEPVLFEDQDVVTLGGRFGPYARVKSGSVSLDSPVTLVRRDTTRRIGPVIIGRPKHEYYLSPGTSPAPRTGAGLFYSVFNSVFIKHDLDVE